MSKLYINITLSHPPPRGLSVDEYEDERREVFFKRYPQMANFEEYEMRWWRTDGKWYRDRRGMPGSTLEEREDL